MMGTGSAPPGAGSFGNGFGGSGEPGGDEQGSGRRKLSKSAKRTIGATSGLVLLGLVGMAMAGSVQATNDEALQPFVEQAQALDDRKASAEELLEALPDEKSATRAFERAAKSAELVAARQGDLQAQGEVATVDEAGYAIEPKDRETQEEADARLHSSAKRDLEAQFQDAAPAESRPGSVRVDAEQPWFGAVGSRDGWTWTSLRPVDYDATGSILVTWELKSADGALLALAESDYDTVNNRFGDVMLTLTDAGQAVLDGMDQAEIDASREANGGAPADAGADAEEKGGKR